MKTVLLRGYYGYNNSGDDALYYSIIDLLSKNSKIDNVITLSKKKLISPENRKVSYSYINPTNLNIIKTLLKSDILIFGGGSQLQDYGKLSLILSLMKTLTIVNISKSLNKNIIYLGVSIGPLETRLGNLIAKAIITKVDYIVVRDKKSSEYLKKQNVEEHKYELIPDLVVNLSKYIKRNKVKNCDSLVIGVNLLPFYSVIREDPCKEEILISNLKGALLKILKKHPNAQLRLFSFQEDEVLNDSEILGKLEVELKNNIDEVDIKIIKYVENPIDMMQEVALCNRFIGMRLHSSIFSYTANIPQIILSYHPKCEGFGNLVGYKSDVLLDLQDGIPSKQIFYSSILNLIEKPCIYMPKINIDQSTKEVENSVKNLEKFI